MFLTGSNLFVWLSSLLILAAKYENWCPLSDSTAEDSSCTLIGPTEWVFAFDVSERRMPFQKDHEIYEIFTNMASAMVQRLVEINRNGPLGVRHQYGLFLWNGLRTQTLKESCDDINELISINWPSLYSLSLTTSHGHDKQTFRDAIKQYFGLCSPLNLQRIVLVFTMTTAARRGEDKSLKQLFNSKESPVPVQVYVIRIIYPIRISVKELYSLDAGVDYPVHKLMLLLQHENYAVQQRLINQSNHFLNCLCRQTENCHFRTTTTKCHFVQQDAAEACIMIRMNKVTFLPKHMHHGAAIVCPAVNVTVACHLPDCIADCDLKQWDSWGLCLPTVKGHYYYAIRRRLFDNASISQYTKSCKKTERVLCDNPTAGGRLSKSHIALIVCSVVALLLVNFGILGIIWKRRQNKDMFVQHLRDRSHSHRQRKYVKYDSSSQSYSTFGGSVVKEPLKKGRIMGKVKKAKGRKVEILLQQKATQEKGSSEAQAAAASLSSEKTKEVKKGN